MGGEERLDREAGVAKSMNVFAPDRFSWEIWVDVASVIS